MGKVSIIQETIREVSVPVGESTLRGDLVLPFNKKGVVLFAHGSGSSRFSPRNRQVAESLRHAGFGTLLVDLLTGEEEVSDRVTGHLRFDLELLTLRLTAIVDWMTKDHNTAKLPIGLFGASTGAGAALGTAALRPDIVKAVVSRGGRPDLAGHRLLHVRSPSLFIVGARDIPVIRMNREAMAVMHAPVSMQIVEGATHLFEEEGTLDVVTELAREFFQRHLVS